MFSFKSKNKNINNLSLSFWVGLLFVFIVFLLALISFIWTPYDVTSLEISERFKGPSFSHVLGTDHFGRDILSMIMVGAQTSIAVALVAVGIGIFFGLPFVASKQISLLALVQYPKPQNKLSDFYFF